MEQGLVTYTALAALLTVTPGPDMAVMLRNVVTGGRGAVLPTALGTCTALLAWGALAAGGLAAVVTASPGLAAALRLGGAAWLAFLGIVALRAAIRPEEPAPAGTGPDAADPSAVGIGPGPLVATAVPLLAPAAAFRAALATNLLNPKVGVFYVSVIPPFLPSALPPLAGGWSSPGSTPASGSAGSSSTARCSRGPAISWRRRGSGARSRR